MKTQKVKNIIFLAMAALALVLAPVAVSASDNPVVQNKHIERGEGPSMHEKLYKDLNLSDGQRKLLEENRNKNREQMKTLLMQRKC